MPSARAFLAQELVGDLDEDAGAVAGNRIGADRTAVLQVLQDGERVLDQLVRLPALEVGDEPDAASIVLAARIEQPARAWTSSARHPAAARSLSHSFQPSWPSPFGSLSSHHRVAGSARASALPHRAPKRGGNKPSFARSRTPPLHGPLPPPVRRSIPLNLPDRMRGCAAASGGAVPCGRSPQICEDASQHRRPHRRFPAGCGRRGAPRR